MTRSEIINLFIEKYGYTSYLEIGVNTPAQPGYNWKNINIETKHGVDPEAKVMATYQMTSDEFFDNHVNRKYDIIFVDGLHIFEQVYRDIINSLKWLNDNGTIIVHDCNPLTEKTQVRIHIPGLWHGDVWKSILKLRMEEPNLSIFTVNTDEGCGVIRRGSQVLFRPESPKEDIYTFPYFDKHRIEILNLISTMEFRKYMGVETKFDRLILYILNIFSAKNQVNL